MDRTVHTPTAVADALRLIPAPACACNASGTVVAANDEMAALAGMAVRGRSLVDLFDAASTPLAASELAAALRAARCWRGALAVGGEEIAVEVRARPGPAGCGAPGTIVLFTDISAWERSQAALRTNVCEQNAILEHAPIGIIFTKPGLLKECNPRLAQMIGYSVDELADRDPGEMFASQEAYKAFRTDAFAALAEGRIYEKSDCQLRRRDGSLFWARVRASAMVPGRREAGIIWIVEDVSETHQARRELQALLNNASLAILFTRERRIRRCNAGFLKMFGYAPGECEGLHVEKLYPSAQAFAGVAAPTYALLAAGETYQTETELVKKDGTPIWGQIIGFPVNPDDLSQGYVWIAEDRTRQRRDEQQLREALQENQAIFDTAVLGIAVVENGHALHANRKMEELFGQAPGGMTGMPVRSLYPDAQAWKAAHLEADADFAAGRVSVSERLLVRADGSTFWGRQSGRPFDLDDPGGRSLWLMDDVTAQHEAADAVLRARDELELRVAARTAELAGANALLQDEIVERRQAEARVHHMAYHDSLTGLPNRALLADRLERAILAAQRAGTRLAVMFLDLDRFKTINDSLGHATGDFLLKEVASRLCQAVRASDTVARLGGDEFVVLMPGMGGQEECSAIGDKIIEVLGAPVRFEGHSLHISPSIGICVYPDDGGDVDLLMRHADAAMYQAKAAGRNNYQFFTERMNGEMAREFAIRALESDLRQALANGEFEPFYQPIMDMGSLRVHALEVLLRWRRPGHAENRGLVLPDDFIPTLEENGMIVPVGEWVIRRACEQSMAWQRAGLAPVPLAINLSARQFMHRALVASIQRIVDETGIDPALVEFEITETALMQHGEQTLEILDQINRMGMRLSIDDFGTGYSSLAYLKRFPVRKIKIDRAFVRELEASSEDRAIVAAVMALANSLGLQVVAEGVETAAQLALLRDYGCQYVQGWLFARALDSEAVRALLVEDQSSIDATLSIGTL
ncbi:MULTISPECIES: EAL domain-containing protein [unclassified Massilia]|uniref:bifunctional diguanylate cyclase/phosphodiesterase n=1 Tax=unclassified Massilia TaxID=2609279 RepID=UPI00178762E2|nr:MULTISPECIES: EAL domain-containing protein [unclassified Massilia]MBD8531216.1 EAL domain-containing protein [Massilia sp. CFBP 13647]MBD8676521.1 EAL domain-containing protein [Massilia sp. CFBP 13721]